MLLKYDRNARVAIDRVLQAPSVTKQISDDSVIVGAASFPVELKSKRVGVHRRWSADIIYTTLFDWLHGTCFEGQESCVRHVGAAVCIENIQPW